MELSENLVALLVISGSKKLPADGATTVPFFRSAPRAPSCRCTPTHCPCTSTGCHWLTGLSLINDSSQSFARLTNVSGSLEEERAAVSDWIDVSNQGGLARNFDIFEYPVVVLTHEDLANGSVEIPLDGYTNKEILLRSGDFSATDAETLEAVMDLIRLRNRNATSPQTIPAGVTVT
jgi:hypothetical protein